MTARISARQPGRISHAFSGVFMTLASFPLLWNCQEGPWQEYLLLGVLVITRLVDK